MKRRAFGWPVSALLCSTLYVSWLGGCSAGSHGQNANTLPPPGPVPAAEAESPQEEASRQLHATLDAYFALRLKRNPLHATYLGDHRYDDRLAITIAPDHRRESLRIDREFLERVQALDPQRLDSADRMSRKIFVRERQHAILGHAFPSHLLPLQQLDNLPNTLAELGSGESAQPFRTAEDFHNFLGRMRDFSRWVDQAISNMREGIARGVVQPRILMERVVSQLDSHLTEDPEESIFFRPLAKADTPVDAELRAVYRETIAESLMPAYARLRDFVRDEYLPRARESHGIHALPDGAAWYAWLVRGATATDLGPKEIHQLGLDEVARIHAEIDGIMAQVGFTGSRQDFFQHVTQDPRFHPDSPEALLEAYRARRQAVEQTVDSLFNLQPRVDYEIRSVEPYRQDTAPAASYQRPSADGSRPGIFYVNTHDLESRPLWAVESLFLHEAVPGHHFQLGLQQELDHLPRFRRFGGQTAFVEGWALYAEGLGHALGLYTDPYQYFGKLNAELWRAIRLVVDTGLHHHGFTREEVIAYMEANSAATQFNAVAEAERYMAIPGQALAYKVGQLRIEALRARAEAMLGDAFDVRAFHDQLLRRGSLPLDLLDEVVTDWLRQQRQD